MYKLLYTKSAVEDIRKLDNIARKRIKIKLEEYLVDPHKYAKKMINSAIGTFRWRIGNYRIVYDIDKSNIVVLRVGHRKEIYK